MKLNQIRTWKKVKVYYQNSTQSQFPLAWLEAHAVAEMHSIKTSDVDGNVIWPVDNPKMLGESTIIKKRAIAFLLIVRTGLIWLLSIFGSS